MPTVTPAISLKAAAPCVEEGAALPSTDGVWLAAQCFLLWRVTPALSLPFQSSDTPSSPSPPNPPGARSEMEEKVT